MFGWHPVSIHIGGYQAERVDWKEGQRLSEGVRHGGVQGRVS
jgi:hypothetical protein